MSSPSDPSRQEALQFDRAEFVAPQQLNCVICRKRITDEYFVANTAVLCPPCRDRLAAGPGPLNAHDVARAAGMGLLSALLSAGVFIAAARVIPWVQFFAAAGMGVLVGVVVRKGSRAVGGWVPQILAVVLSYFALGLTWLPLVSEHATHAPGFFAMLVAAEALPVLVCFQQPIYAVLIGVTLLQAWRANRRVIFKFSGPLRVSAPAPEVSTGG